MKSIRGAFEELLCQDLKQQQEQQQQQQQEKSEAHLIVLRTCSIVDKLVCLGGVQGAVRVVFKGWGIWIGLEY